MLSVKLKNINSNVKRLIHVAGERNTGHGVKNKAKGGLILNIRSYVISEVKEY